MRPVAQKSFSQLWIFERITMPLVRMGVPVHVALVLQCRRGRVSLVRRSTIYFDHRRRVPQAAGRGSPASCIQPKSLSNFKLQRIRDPALDEGTSRKIILTVFRSLSQQLEQLGLYFTGSQQPKWQHLQRHGRLDSRSTRSTLPPLHLESA
jgi:hypothetical protein